MADGATFYAAEFFLNASLDDVKALRTNLNKRANKFIKKILISDFSIDVNVVNFKDFTHFFPTSFHIASFWIIPRTLECSRTYKFYMLPESYKKCSLFKPCFLWYGAHSARVNGSETSYFESRPSPQTSHRDSRCRQVNIHLFIANIKFPKFSK